MRFSKIITGAASAGPRAPQLTLEHQGTQNIVSLVAGYRASAAVLVRRALVLTGLLVMVALLIAPAASSPAHPDSTFTSLFASLSPSGWVGGDIAGSVGLPDGRTAWFIGDTITASSPMGLHFVHNSIVITGRGRPRVISNRLPSLPDGSFFWPAAARVQDGELWVLCQRIVQTGRGLWDFRFAGTWLGRISIGSWRLISLRPVFRETCMTNWTSALLDSGPYTYIYGVETDGLASWLHVARVPKGRLDRPWRFYTGAAWAREPDESVRVLAGVSGVSMLDLGSRGLRLVSQQPMMGRLVYSWRARTPVGPFTNRHAIYDTGNCGARTYTYNALGHPQHATRGTMLFSFNVNSYDFLSPKTAALYRPQFFRVAITAL